MSRRWTRPLLGVVLGATLGLSACSTPLPTPDPDPAPPVAQPAVTPEGVDRVLERIGEALAEGDAQASTDPLAPRVAGPALALRSVEYRLQQAGVPDAVTPIPMSAQTVVVPATDDWPRTLMVVTEPPADLQAPLLLTLVQETPRSQYVLWSWARLFPGVQTPTTDAPAVGSAEVPLDSTEVAVPPGEVVARYVDVLTHGAASPHATTFTDDPLRAGIVATREAFSALVGPNGTLAETYTASPEPPRVIGTADGGAIVVGTFQTVTTISLVDSTLTVADPTTVALLGKDVVTSNLAITWLSVVAFAVPPAGSPTPVQVLGAEHSAIAVTGE